MDDGRLYRWTENSFTFFLYQKQKEILIRYSRIILTASKDKLISKTWRVWPLISIYLLMIIKIRNFYNRTRTKKPLFESSKVLSSVRKTKTIGSYVQTFQKSMDLLCYFFRNLCQRWWMQKPRYSNHWFKAQSWKVFLWLGKYNKRSDDAPTNQKQFARGETDWRHLKKTSLNTFKDFL